MTISKKIAVIGFLIHLLMGCAAQQKSTDLTYHEDLFDVRPRVAAPVDPPIIATSPTKETKSRPVSYTKTVNEKVDVVLDSIDRFNLMRRSVDGYTIQIYSGQNREEAMNVKKKMSTDLPELTANLQYQQPKFRVTVGKYYSKLEAHPDLMQLRKSFSSAILVPEKIAIR